MTEGTSDRAKSRSRILGCLLGGAVGDALGAPVEFLDLDEIRMRFGPNGISDYAPVYGREGAMAELKQWPDHREVERAVRRAVDRAGAAPRAEDLEELGGGWVAEEALAIGLAAALSGRDFRESVLLAVNHSGDSDSTGSIAGQIRGVMDGVEAIPESWLVRLELRREIETIAEDLYRCFVEGVPDAPDNPDGTYDWNRYPGW